MVETEGESVGMATREEGSEEGEGVGVSSSSPETV